MNENSPSVWTWIISNKCTKHGKQAYYYQAQGVCRCCWDFSPGRMRKPKKIIFFLWIFNWKHHPSNEYKTSINLNNYDFYIAYYFARGPLCPILDFRITSCNGFCCFYIAKQQVNRSVLFIPRRCARSQC